MSKELNRHNELKADTCYSIFRAWTGREKPTWVVAYPDLYGDFIAFEETQEAAIEAAKAHRVQRMAIIEG